MAQEPQGAYEQFDYDCLGGCLCVCDRGILVLLSTVQKQHSLGRASADLKQAEGATALHQDGLLLAAGEEGQSAAGRLLSQRAFCWAFHRTMLC